MERNGSGITIRRGYCRLPQARSQFKSRVQSRELRVEEWQSVGCSNSGLPPRLLDFSTSRLFVFIDILALFPQFWTAASGHPPLAVGTCRTKPIPMKPSPRGAVGSSVAVLSSRLRAIWPTPIVPVLNSTPPFQALTGADWRAIRAQFAASKKVMSFVCKYFLASFPLFLYFLARPRYLRQPGNLEPGRIPASQTLAGTRVASKSSNSAFKARIVQSILSSF